MSETVVCPPAALDIALAKGREPLARIIERYGPTVVLWAMRGGFYDTKSGSIAGLLCRGGGLIQKPTGKDWPCLVVRVGPEVPPQGFAFLTTEKVAPAVAVFLAAAGGPIVLQNGSVHEASILEFPGIQPKRRRPRTAIGIRKDEMLTLAVYPAATVHEVADDLLEREVLDAMMFDGGHGTEFYDGTQCHTFEGRPARIPWAWVVIGGAA
jgi:hypothetical protein